MICLYYFSKNLICCNKNSQEKLGIHVDKLQVCKIHRTVMKIILSRLHFCYLGDVIGKGGGAEEASRARVRCAWGKFRNLRMLLTARGASLRVKGKIYRACAQRVLVYGSET